MFTPCPTNRCSYDIPERAINLPSYHDLTDDELDRVCVLLEQLHGEAQNGIT